MLFLNINFIKELKLNNAKKDFEIDRNHLATQ